MTTRICTACSIEKPIEEFPLHNTATGTRRYICAVCRKYNRAKEYVAKRDEMCDREKEKRKRNPLKMRGYDLKKRFKLTLETFDQLFKSQGSRCACCYTTDPGHKWWHVDHDHACCSSRRKTCGKCIRGILCHHCNMALGNARDDIARIKNMARFLEEYRDRPVIEVV